MTVEMSLIASFCLLASTARSPDGEAIKKYGFFHGWALLTLVPVISNAVGGILVGLVTAYAGGVRKGNLSSWCAAESIAMCIDLFRNLEDRVTIQYMTREAVQGPHVLANWARKKHKTRATYQILDEQRQAHCTGVGYQLVCALCRILIG